MFLMSPPNHQPKSSIIESPPLMLFASLTSIPVVVCRRWLDHYAEGLQRAGATRKSPKVLLGYHGTPSRNTDAIMNNGFCPRCRRSAGDGAYFSGELSYSVSYARKSGSSEAGDVFLVAIIDHG